MTMKLTWVSAFTSTVAFALLSACSAAKCSTLFIAAYPNDVIVLDDVTGQIETRIQLTTGTPFSFGRSMDKKTVYVITNEHNGVEVIDVATRTVTSHFVLDTFRTRYRLGPITPDPTGKFLYTVATQIDKLSDHYTFGRPKYAVIDLAAQKITKMIDIEKQDESSNLEGYWVPPFQVSTDGKYLYQFRNKVAILDAATMKVIERLDLATPQDPSMRHLVYSDSLGNLSHPGSYLSLVTEEDPFVHHRVFGIARFDLDSRDFRFSPIGPAVQDMSHLVVAPDMKNAWAQVTEGSLGNMRCEFWRFDLTSNQVLNKSEFPCRTGEDHRLNVSGDGKRLYTWGNGYDVEVYDSATLKHVAHWDLNSDVVLGGGISVD